MRSGSLVPGPGFPFFINWGHSLIGGRDYKLYVDLAAIYNYVGAEPPQNRESRSSIPKRENPAPSRFALWTSI